MSISIKISFATLSGTDGFDNTVYQEEKNKEANTLSTTQIPSNSRKRPRFSSSTSNKHGGFSNVVVSMSNQRRHKPQHHRPTFAGPIQNVTVNVGQEATLECRVNYLDKYKVVVFHLWN